MNNSIKNFFALVTSIFLITGCQTELKKVEIEMKSEDEQKQMLDTYTYDDYKRVFEGVMSVAAAYDENEQLVKWIIRTLAMEKLYYKTDLTDEEVVHLSKKAMDEDKVWKLIAKEEYGIKVTEDEVDKNIQEGPDTSDLPQHLAYADALGMSLVELNHNFDRDLYEKNVIWLKLRTELTEKYNITDNNQLVEKYGEEVKTKMNKL